MEFTRSQTEAIQYRGGSILVSAGAGSGKTRVLTERLMEYIDPKDSRRKGENIDRFLIITFTRAAAGELRGRISDAIADRLRQNPLNAHLRRQLLLCHNAHIGTIHSFCSDVLRENAGMLGISSGFRILEEERSERLRASALERVLERAYQQRSEPFLRLVDSVGAGRDDTRLTGLMLKLHSDLQSHAYPDQWIQQQLDVLSGAGTLVSDTLWGRELMEDAAEEAVFWAGELDSALHLIRAEEKICHAYESSFCETADAIRRLARQLKYGWDEAGACFPIPFPRLLPIRQNPDPVLCEHLKALRDDCKKAMEKLSAVFSVSSAAVMEELRLTSTEMSELLRLTMCLEEEFQIAKKRMNGLDFSDLEHLSIRLLLDENGAQTELARDIASRYVEVMVDEYQDVSRVQDRIFHAVSRNTQNLFFVGDLKQSIYRFRLADPGIFTEKSRRYGENLRGERLIRLQENFRSRPEVLNAVNAVFTRCMSQALGDLDYGPDDALIPGADYLGRGKLPELLLLPREEAESADLEAEASLVAQEIKRRIQTDYIQDGDHLRPMQYRDIVILLRAANTVGPAFRRVLISAGIPVASAAGGDFYQSVEVSAVFAMLSLLDNPHRDIPLISLLRSPSFGFSEDRLSLIRAELPDADFYSALCASSDPAANDFVRRLNKLRLESADLNPVQLTDRIVSELDLWAICSAMPDGEHRLQHLTELTRLAETFRDSGELGLHRFVCWLENLQKKGQDPECCEETGDAVRILSVHRSKGLEFPVVFYSGLGRMFNKQDSREAVLVHPELGLGSKVTDSARKIEYPTVVRRAIEKRLNREMLSEEMRLLYVAMTRAREQLVLTACVRKVEERLEAAERLSQSAKIPGYLLMSASNPSQWLIPAALHSDAIRLRIAHLEEVSRTQETDTDFSQGCGEELLHELDENLNWQYPYADAELLPSKLTATELKLRAQTDPDAVPLLPDTRKAARFEELDLDTSHLSAARRGTAMHLVLQHIDFSKTSSLEDIREEIERLTRERFLLPEEARTVNPENIRAFFESSIGSRILRARSCWREFRFSLLTDATSVLDTPAEGEKVLLQGVVDCLFEEDGKLIIVDYKTDHVSGEAEMRSRAESYRIQLETYALAMARVFDMPVNERILFFLESNKALSI